MPGPAVREIPARKLSNIVNSHNNRRPTITTNEKHLSKFIPHVPGNRSFAKAVGGPTVLIIGDSIIQRIRKRQFNSCLNGNDATIKCFPGATAARVNYYLEPELIEGRYKTVIIHAATNDLYDSTTDEIVNEMKDIRETCIRRGVDRVIFSGIVRRRARDDLQMKRDAVNTMIEGLCYGEWKREGRIQSDFIFNDNILDRDLYRDGLHLIESGIIKLADNFLNCLN